MDADGLTHSDMVADLIGSSKYGHKVGHWDDPGLQNTAQAAKEQFENCIQKAGMDIPGGFTPWNASEIEFILEDLPTSEGTHKVLILADNGRGLDKAEFIEGFHDRSHSHNRYGHGSKDADAFLSTGVYYFTAPDARQGKAYTIIGRAGKDLSAALQDECLHVKHVLIPNSIRQGVQNDPINFKPLNDLTLTWMALRNEEGHAILLDERTKQLNEVTGKAGRSPFYTSKDASGLTNALILCNRLLPFTCNNGAAAPAPAASPPRAPITPGGQHAPLVSPSSGPQPQPQLQSAIPNFGVPGVVPGVVPGSDAGVQGTPIKDEMPAQVGDEVLRGLHYVTGDERRIDLAHMLEQNYLFPPVDLVERVEDGDDVQLVLEQIRIARGLQPNNYYTHPVPGYLTSNEQLYSPTVVVQNQTVNWANNTLLANLKHEHSPVLAMPVDVARYGDSNGEPPARIAIAYLGNSVEARQAADAQSGVAVYSGCRRVCEPELSDGNWSLGGMAVAQMQHARTISQWSIFHHTYMKGTRELLGEELYRDGNAVSKKGSVYAGRLSHLLVLKGVHVAIVVKPGLLGLQQNKKEFTPTNQARDLLLDSFREAVRWILEHPPSDLHDMLAIKAQKRMNSIDLKKRLRALPPPPASAPAPPSRPAKRLKGKPRTDKRDSSSDDDDEEEEEESQVPEEEEETDDHMDHDANGDEELDGEAQEEAAGGAEGLIDGDDDFDADILPDGVQGSQGGFHGGFQGLDGVDMLLAAHEEEEGEGPKANKSGFRIRIKPSGQQGLHGGGAASFKAAERLVPPPPPIPPKAKSSGGGGGRVSGGSGGGGKGSGSGGGSGGGGKVFNGSVKIGGSSGSKAAKVPKPSKAPPEPKPKEKPPTPSLDAVLDRLAARLEKDHPGSAKLVDQVKKATTKTGLYTKVQLKATAPDWLKNR